MFYYSLNKNSTPITFQTAALQGQAPDKGLYFPEYIPHFGLDFWDNLASYSKEDIALKVMLPYVGEDIPLNVLSRIAAETIDFGIPLVKVSEESYALELFHGPTLAFKDVGARFMSRCLGYFNRNESRFTTVLVATSGDTGGAVANGFLGVEGVNVIILYPSGKVSPVQELQLTTLGKNITALEIKGSFDDCQSMVKMAFGDPFLTEKLKLTSANSINVARWIPQQIYYILAYRQWQEALPPVFSVPSGNFGNICAGLLAYKSGMPVHHFIAACNANAIVPNYMNTGEYLPKQAIPTLSNAMDVGNPSNFIRILEMFNYSNPDLKNCFSSISVSDILTEKTIETVYKKYHYCLDPHGAVAYYALEQYLNRTTSFLQKDYITHPQKGIFLETAHPVKFPDIVERVTGKPIEIPQSVVYLLGKEKKSVLMDPDFEIFKEWLLQ